MYGRSEHRSDHRSSSYSSRKSPSPPPHRSGRSTGSGRSHRSPSPRRHRRSPSPGPSRESQRERPEERSDKSLPKSFCRERDDDDKKRAIDDNRNVLERMEKSFEGGPLEVLYQCITDNTKLKVWTRNYKEVRGICTGYIVAFDKHWNLVMKDVDEVFLKPRASKTPYVWDLGPSDRDAIPEMKAKVPRKKKAPKTAGSEDETVASVKRETSASDSEATSATESAMESSGKPPEEQSASETEGQSDQKKKKKKKNNNRRKKKKEPVMDKRHVGQLFIRGDNIVMVALLNDEYDEEEEEEEGEKDKEEAAGDT